MRLRALLAVTVSGIAVACSSAAVSDVGTTEAAQTGTSLAVLEGREWASCWFDVTAGAAQLSCTSTKRAAIDPLHTTLQVTAGPAAKKLDVEAGGTVVVGTFARTDFPLVLLMKAELPLDAAETLGVTRNRDISNTLTVARPEDLPAARPAKIAQPFALRPTAIIDAEGKGEFLVDAAYGVSLAPYKSLPSTTELKVEASFFGNEVAGKIRWWAAPATGGVKVAIMGPNAVDGTISGPGYYAVTASGIRPATTDEIARDFPRGAPLATPAGDAGSPSRDASASAATDARPSDPTPGCGAHDEPRCATGCDPGHRYESTQVVCLACGNAGQTYCVDATGSAVCNAGARYEWSSRSCVAP